ncbi:Fic family protein [Frankia sp. Cppng1_Ct_nod]|uniref:Fic/DOC family protein n=1 Tax=Frankia sp. Cppng1_Ct_nod TaxID=2897162 RepID=UPI0010413041|nr:Fic family protein [Frankia sp. Cppng1_Ct_nod]
MDDDPYCWPGTNCLRNKLGIRDAEELAAVEHTIVGLQRIRLTTRSLPGAFDTAHLQRFHRALFGDIYDWAGTIRNIRMAKGTSTFCLPQFLHEQLAELFAGLAADGYLIGLARGPFLERFATLYGELNALHPFREGNGRTQQAFLRQLAAAAGWKIRWDDVDKQDNDEACAAYFNTQKAKILIDLLAPTVLPIIR